MIASIIFPKLFNPSLSPLENYVKLTESKSIIFMFLKHNVKVLYILKIK